MSDTPLVWAVGDRNPSITDTITVGGVAVDLTSSTVQFKMRAVGSATLKVNQAATIVTPAAGTVRYDWAALDVDTEGFYLVWWEVTTAGKVQEKQEAIIEFRAHAPTSGALVELAEVRQAMETRASDTKLDDDIRRLIPVASRMCMQFCDREFAPATASATRRFKVALDQNPGGGYLVDLAPYDLRTVSAMTLHPEATSPTTVTTADYSLQPVTSQDGTYYKLALSPYFSMVSQTSIRFGYCYLDITGAWGFATVPVDVKEAAIIAIRSWLRRDTTVYAQVDADMRQLQPEPYGTYKLPPASKAALDQYTRWDL